MKRAETCSCSLCNKLYISIPPYSCVRQVYKLQSSLIRYLNIFQESSRDIVNWTVLAYFAMASFVLVMHVLLCHELSDVGRSHSCSTTRSVTLVMSIPLR